LRSFSAAAWFVSPPGSPAAAPVPPLGALVRSLAVRAAVACSCGAAFCLRGVCEGRGERGVGRFGQREPALARRDAHFLGTAGGATSSTRSHELVGGDTATSTKPIARTSGASRSLCNSRTRVAALRSPGALRSFRDADGCGGHRCEATGRSDQSCERRERAKSAENQGSRILCLDMQTTKGALGCARACPRESALCPGAR